MDKKHQQAVEYLQGALDILRTSLELGRGRQPVFYRVAAAQLRLLLCDTTRRHDRMEDIALARRVMPELRLLPLVGRQFDASRERIPLSDWLLQPLPSDREQNQLTIRQLIRQVCDQDGGVHVDLNNKVSETPAIHREWIFLIGAYIVAEFEELLSTMNS